MAAFGQEDSLGLQGSAAQAGVSSGQDWQVGVRRTTQHVCSTDPPRHGLVYTLSL